MKHSLKYLLILLFAAAGCAKKETGPHIEQKIEQAATACKDTSKCTLNMKDLTTFEWDKMHVFNSVVPRDVIEAAIGMPYPAFEEGTRPMIFVNKGVIVYSENNVDGLAAGTPGQVIFSYTVGLKTWVFTPEKANFRVKIEKAKNKVFYELFQSL